MEPIESPFLTLWHFITKDFGMQSLKTRTFLLQNTIIALKKIKKISEIPFTILFVIFPMV